LKKCNLRIAEKRKQLILATEAILNITDMIKPVAIVFSLFTIVLLASSTAFPQQNKETFEVFDYKPSFSESFIYKNFFLTGSDYKWVPKSGWNFMSISAFSTPSKFYQIDGFFFSHTFFKIGLSTRIINEGPFTLTYFFPFGLRLPLICGKGYTLSLNSDYYLFRYDIDEGVGYKWESPTFMDNQLRLESNIGGISAILGYRTQFTPWESTYVGPNGSPELSWEYSGNLSGAYLGVSIGLKYSKSKNGGLADWRTARSQRTSSAYSAYISKYRSTPFSNKKMLSKVARTDADPDLRLAAIEKVQDYNLLEKIAVNDPLAEMRTAAIRPDFSKSLLAVIALGDSASMVRIKALSLVDDQDVLIKVAIQDRDPKLRMVAIEKVDDQNILLTSAQNDPNLLVRVTAVKRINNQEALKKIYSGSADPEVQIASIDRIQDETFMLGVALNNSFPAVRLVAANKINDQLLLTKIVLETFDANLRETVFKRVFEQEYLLKITVGISDWQIRSNAFNRLNDSLLVELVNITNDPAIHLAVQVRSGQTTWKEAFSEVGMSNLVGAIALVRDPLPTTGDVLSLCHKFIALGDASRIPELRNLLVRFGDKSLAEDYMNCGNTNLEESGRKWCADHGYLVEAGPGSNRVRWGEKK